MKKYTNILAAMMLALFCVDMQASGSVDLVLYLTADGKSALHNPPMLSGGMGIKIDDFIAIFVTGDLAHEPVTMDSLKPLVAWYGYSEAEKAAQRQAVLNDILGARNVLAEGGLVTNIAGQNLLGKRLLSKAEIIALFVTGAWNNQTTKEEINATLTEYFQVVGAPHEQTLAEEIIKEQRRYNDVRPEVIELTEKGLNDLALPSADVHMYRAQFINLFVTGTSKTVSIDSAWLQVATTLPVKAANAMLEDIMAARQALKPSDNIVDPHLRNLEYAHLKALELTDLLRAA